MTDDAPTDDAPAPALPAGTIHATCIAIGTQGVLIRGPSGSGKSALALALMLDAPRALPPAELVADDRVLLAMEDGALVARPPAALAGLVEARGLGIRRVPYRPFVAVRWLVDLAAADAVRMPQAGSLRAEMYGIELKRIAAQGPGQARLLLAAAFTTDDHQN